MRALSIMPVIPGVVLLWWVARELPAERLALQMDNAIFREDFSVAENLFAVETDQELIIRATWLLRPVWRVR